MTKQKWPARRLAVFPNPPVNPDDATRRRLVDGRANQLGEILVMTKRFLNCSVHVATTALCLGAMINATSAGSFTRGCAARDLQILMLIEQREATNAISAERLSDAMLTMMNARMMCYDGHEADALTMYDSIASGLTPSMNRRMFPVLTQP